MGFAAIAKVTDERWIACAVRDEIQFGMEPGGELKIETTICRDVRQSGEMVVINHVSEDDAFASHPTPALYGFQSYISVPIIRKDGVFFGTLCAIDPKPAHLKNQATISMFKLFADLIAFHLQSIEQLALAESTLLEERETAELREQFIAILGHDLRNPVGAVTNSAQLLLRTIPLNERGIRLVNIIQDSGYRMAGLIENIMDFARGRLGGGLVLSQSVNEQLEKTLNQVITELQVIWPDHIIETDFDLKTPVFCDSKRIAQLFSNILGNALTYGKAGKPVLVEAKSDDNEFTLSVINSCNKIPAAVIERLFQPFSRGEVKPNQQGLGLGLYIAAEISRAHGGTLNVISAEQETCFTLKIPQD
ncbi:GAF domain-containing protein [Mucilaginibacter sp. HMF7410]|uniref:histidine kinase n=2 Tax=Mucilaginibacter arboris TaxID=2682090 RepID=A0A7K1SVL4_9SPHI|nr:GAF domain-containing protein [Mucilaginibacter arboris]